MYGLVWDPLTLQTPSGPLHFGGWGEIPTREVVEEDVPERPEEQQEEAQGGQEPRRGQKTFG